MRTIFTALLLLFALPASAQHFLDLHTGEYTGMLYLLRPGAPADSIPFKMIVQPTGETGRWTNTVIYNYEKDPQSKNYEWVADAANGEGRYIMDEKDGILISETLIGNTFYCNYTVDNMFYVVRTAFGDRTIDFELSCYKTAGKRESESKPDETGTTWKVDSFPLLTVQKGTLQKVGK
jgi:hypothetical protein